MREAFDIVVVGTGPASAFFLHAWLANAPASARVLWLEKGPRRDHAWRMAGPEDRLLDQSVRGIDNPKASTKPWKFATAVGGTSLLWWACTPRFLPADFELKTRFGVGRDWPLTYAQLEPHYGEVEGLMGVAGDSDDTPFERSTPYPLPAHTYTEPERRLKAAWPEHFFHQPAARPTRAIDNADTKRPACCANGVCGRCPIDSKFTVLNGLGTVFADARVTLRTGCAVQSVETEAGRASGVVYLQGGKERRVGADLVALGANALFNPHILLRSGLEQGPVGRGLHEQASVRVFVDLDGVDNFQGSSSITGHGYMHYEGVDRAKRAACLIETWNVPHLRWVRNRPDKLRQLMAAQFIYEDLPRDDNRVVFNRADPTRPKVIWKGRSDYALAAIANAQADAEAAFGQLPVDAIRLDKDGEIRDTEGHILGTTRMGDDPKDSVVDRHLVHHQVRNLLVLGGSTFPTSGPANPTLTISALSRWAASHL